MRADVNLSVREEGTQEFGTRTEMKNLNSFKAIARALKERENVRSNSSKRENPLSRRRDDGMTIKNHLMPCVPKKMLRIIVISRNRILYQS